MKIDLHRHFEGSHTARALGFSDGIVMQGPPGDAAAFYAAIEASRRAYVSTQAITSLAYDTFVDSVSEVDALEMRVSLFSMTRTLLGKDWRATAPVAFAEKARGVLLGLLQSRDRAQVTSGKTILVRMGLSRTFESAEHYEAMADMVAEHASALCGLDVLGILMSGDKEPLQPGLVAVIDRLRPVLPDLTIHAGEFEDHKSVERALALQPRGIGHGVHAVGDARVMERLAKEGVTLEVCPGSNEALIPHAVAHLRQMHGGAPVLTTLQKHHVHAVLGSDDPVPMATSYAAEWAAAERAGVDMTRLQQDIMRRWNQLCTRS